MKALNEALKRKHEKSINIKVVIEGPEEKENEGSDLAPEVKDAGENDEESEVLEKVAANSAEAPMGRAMTLDEKAHSKMREKMKSKKKA